MPQDIVEISHYDQANRLIGSLNLTTYAYYESFRPILDSNDARAKAGTRRLVGKMFDSKGTLVQEFENIYDERGRLIQDKVVFSSGEIFEGQYDPDTGIKL